MSDREWLEQCAARLSEISQSILDARNGDPVTTRRLENWSADIDGIRRAIAKIATPWPNVPEKVYA